MLNQPDIALFLAYAVMGVLGFLSLIRLRSILVLSRTDPDRFRAAVPAWAASLFGLLALVSLGLAIPLETIDGFFGGSNLANLLQSTLTVLSFCFFREAVQKVVFSDARHISRWVLAGCLIAFSVPFFLIMDRGRTSTLFMAMHVNQLAAVAYNFIYMAVLAWIVGDMIWMLRRRFRGIYSVFIAGLVIILLSTFSEVTYYITSHIAPNPISSLLGQAFYVLFFGGILVLASGWVWILVSEREYLGRLELRFLSLKLARVLFRLRRHGAREKSPLLCASVPKQRTPGGTLKPRLLVDEYQPGESTPRSPLAVLSADSGATIALDLLGSDAEQVAYRLIVQIRNVVVIYAQQLNPSEEELVNRVESRYPGLHP